MSSPRVAAFFRSRSDVIATSPDPDEVGAEGPDRLEPIRQRREEPYEGALEGGRRVDGDQEGEHEQRGHEDDHVRRASRAGLAARGCEGANAVAEHLRRSLDPAIERRHRLQNDQTRGTRKTATIA
jgi:hypothetical protein